MDDKINSVSSENVIDTMNINITLNPEWYVFHESMFCSFWLCKRVNLRVRAISIYSRIGYTVKRMHTHAYASHRPELAWNV